MSPIDITQVGSHVLFVAALVWALTFLFAPMVPAVKTDIVAFVFAIILGGTAIFAGYLVGNWFELAGQVILVSLFSNAAENYLHRAGLTNPFGSARPPDPKP